MFTDGQNEVQQELQDVLERHVRAFSDEDPGLLVDWACVAQLTRFGDDGAKESAYHLIFAGGEMEEHRAIGLWEMGIHLLKFGVWPDRGDDDG